MFLFHLHLHPGPPVCPCWWRRAALDRSPLIFRLISVVERGVHGENESASQTLAEGRAKVTHLIRRSPQMVVYRASFNGSLIDGVDENVDI